MGTMDVMVQESNRRGRTLRYNLWCISQGKKVDDPENKNWDFSAWVNGKFMEYKEEHGINYCDPKTEKFNIWLKDKVGKDREETRLYCNGCGQLVYSITDEITGNYLCGVCYSPEVSYVGRM